MKRLLLVLALLPLSCQLERELNPALGPGDLYGVVEQPADLPVPRELKLRVAANQSRYLQEGSFRSAYLIYEGKISLESLRQYLRERLPDHSWELLSEERPANERAVQHWVAKRENGVRYLLLAELENEGGVSRLSYDLRTSRSTARAPAGSPAGSARAGSSRTRAVEASRK